MRISLRVLPLFFVLWTAPAHAALDADLIVVHGSEWRQVFPIYAAAAKAPSKGSSALAKLPPIVLFAEGEEPWTQATLSRLRAKKTLWIGPEGSRPEGLELPGKKVESIEAPPAKLVFQVMEAAFGGGERSERVWVSDGRHVGGALVAAALAASEQAPLLVAEKALFETVEQARRLGERIQAKEIVLVGDLGSGDFVSTEGLPLRSLSPSAALALYNKRARESRHLVTVAPSDAEGSYFSTRHSVAAPPYLLAKGAALAWVGREEGAQASPEQALAWWEAQGRGPFDYVTLIGDYVAIPMEEAKDIDQEARGVAQPRVHKLPPFTAPAGMPHDRAVGRLAAQDVYDLSRWILRLVHSVRLPGDGKGAVVFANLDEKFILGETISRSSSSDLANVGARVRSYYQAEVTPERVRHELDKHALILWEGHPRDLTLDDDALPIPAEPLPPSTYFLQGCYTLDRSDPSLLVERGANAVIGTYMAVYSASGSGFARAFLNAQIYDGATDGEAMVAAKNFLLAVVELKKRRGHSDWRKTLRAAQSFDLWGDPTARPAYSFGRPKLQPVRAELKGDRLSVRIPKAMLPEARTERYVATTRPGSVATGLYNLEGEERRLSELFFFEVDVPEELGDRFELVAPTEEDTYAWLFSPRTRRLSLLVHETALASRADGGTLHFRLKPAGEMAKDP